MATTPQREVKRTKREALPLADWQDDLLAQVFLVTLNPKLLDASPGRGTAGAIFYNEELATEVASVEGEVTLDESFFDKVLIGQCMREIENFQPVEYLLACYRSAVTVGKASIPLRFLSKGKREAQVTELRNASLKSAREVVVRYAAQAISNTGFFAENAGGRKQFINVMQQPMSDTGGPPQGFLEHLIYACQQGDSEITLGQVFNKIFDDLALQMSFGRDLSNPVKLVKIDSYMPQLDLLSRLLANKALREQLATLDSWLPKNEALDKHTGVSLENTFLGAFFRLQPQEPDFHDGTVDLVEAVGRWTHEVHATPAENQAFNTVIPNLPLLSPRSSSPSFLPSLRSSVRPSVRPSHPSLPPSPKVIPNLRKGQDALHAKLLEICKVLLKSKSTKEKLLQWIGLVVDRNFIRTTDGYQHNMRDGPPVASSDGMLSNLAIVLLKLCEPFLDPNDEKAIWKKIDTSYMLDPPRFDASCLSHPPVSLTPFLSRPLPLTPPRSPPPPPPPQVCCS
jgi:hypothetical protein